MLDASQTPLDAVVEFYRTGLTQPQITERTGLSASQINRLVRKAKDTGLLPERAPASSKRARRCRLYDAYCVTDGRVADVYDALDDAQFIWLAEETRKCGCATIAEYLTELVRDAHAEATESL